MNAWPGHAHVPGDARTANLLLLRRRGSPSYQATAGGLQGKPPRLRSAAPKVCWTLVAGLLAAILSNKAAVSAGISSMPTQDGHAWIPLALLLGWIHEEKLGGMLERSPRPYLALACGGYEKFGAGLPLWTTKAKGKVLKVILAIMEC